MKIGFAGDGWGEYLYWQQQDKKTLKKINELLQSIDRDGPLKGLGKPEVLKHRPNSYSRRIDEKNRLVYEIIDGMIVVKSRLGHYEDC